MIADAHDPRRIIELARTEPQRADQRVRLRRDRVHTDALRISIFDVKPTVPPIYADIERAILADLRRKDRPGVRVIAATHGVSVNTVQLVAHAQ